MPSYQYLRDIKPEDLKPEEKKELTAREKRKNWWHYHKVWVIVGSLLLAVVGYSVFEVVTRVNPDLNVTLLAPYSLPEPLITKLEDGLETFIEDINGDGRVVARISALIITAPDTGATGTAGYTDMGEDPNVIIANEVKLSADLQTGESMLFLLEGTMAETYQLGYGIFGTSDGAMAPEGSPAAELGLRFANVPGLRSMDLTLEDDTGGSLDAHEVMDSYYIGLRPYYGTALEGNSEQLERWEYARGLLQAMAASG